MSADVTVARVYDDEGSSSDDATGRRVLVDRLWPRGVSEAEAPWDEWAKDVAPSPELRTWYAHDPAKFDEFVRQYDAELESSERRAAFDQLRQAADAGPLTLLTATRDVEHSHARVLADRLRSGRP